MPSLLERLRRALHPQYEVEREIPGGGMGLVFVGRDVRLDRRVALKVMRPELATAQAVGRFLREARVLARLSHPNIVPVHAAGDAEGLFYYVMDYVEGETLEARIRRGPLSTDEARKLGRDLLDGLEAAHAAGVIHRDLKPSNVFLLGERALLADFGIAKPEATDLPGTTQPGGIVGTPGYMPPEQAAGGAVTPRTDLYATGMLLYEALTGRRWSILAGRDRADWSGVPRRLAPVLRRALAWAPEERWPDAASFRRALWRTRTRPYVQRTIALTATALLAGWILLPRAGDALCRAWRVPLLCAAPAPSVLAIPPFEMMNDPDPALARTLAGLTLGNLAGIPDLTLTPLDASVKWSRRVQNDGGAIPVASFPDLGAQYVAWALTHRRDDRLEVRITVYEAAGRPKAGQPVLHGSVSDPAALADDVASAILGILGELPELSGHVQANREFVLAELAFQRNAWRTAVEHYEAALAIDPAFAQARWRAWNAWQWLGWGTPYSDLHALYREHGAGLRELDRMLIEAELAEPGRARLEKYRAVRERYPHDTYAAFLEAEELFVRGPLVGVSLERGAQALEEVVARDSLLSSALTYLAMARIRLGEREPAGRVIERLQRVAAPPEEVDLYFPALFQQAYLERFEPERAALVRVARFEAGGLPTLLFASRWGLALDLPETERALGTLLARAPDAGARANGHEATGLALVALGRIVEALAEIDAATEGFATAEARLQAAQWRVVLPALGMPGVPPAERARGRVRLEELARNEALGARAAWTLAFDALTRGERAPARRWRARFGGPEVAEETRDLGRLLRAAEAAAAGDPAAALAESEPLLSRTMQYEGDPFVRAVLHWLRGEWRAATGDLRGADAEWLWYENQDVVGYPRGEAQAAEVDWALSTYARHRRADAAWRRGDLREACRRWTRALDLWAHADSAVAALAATAAARRAEACTG